MWRPTQSGGKSRYYELEVTGPDILRLVTEEELVPNKKYYLVDPVKSNIFYETSFSPEVSWETIIEFVNTNKIFIKHGENKRTEERPRLRVINQRLF
jgi:hypothetical protein